MISNIKNTFEKNLSILIKQFNQFIKKCLFPKSIKLEKNSLASCIDLNDKTGIRINQGDSQKWKENTKREWDKYTFGCYGCWVMGDDGNLDYVPEEEYTEELWNEQKKNGERNRASFSMHK